MKAILYKAQRDTPLEEVPVPELGPGEALIAVEACGLCGTDIVKIEGATRKPPVHLGHELAGRIAQLGAGVKRFKKGDRVVVAHHVPCFECHYCRRGQESMCREFKNTNLDPGGFAQFTRVSARHVEHVMLPIPAKLGYAQAAMTEPLACCLRNVRRMNLQEGDCAAIIGLGFIGVMTAQLLQRAGVTVVGVDLDPTRVRFAQKLGIEHAYTGREGRMDQILASVTEARGADALIFTAGTPELVIEKLSWLRDGGIVNVFASFHPNPIARLDLNAIYHRELTFMSSYSPEVKDLKDALSLIAKGEIDVSSYTRDAFPLSDFAEAMRQVRGREVLKAILLPQKVGAEAAR
ncbi:MAG TPA: alcohol dehydrogenase catalytic domain-containing protein [Elusimicrobiota bacterium]|jgi:L-iditol 2-dehydrogenase|nr:alcohol dehydrogenase catalytic domain-containing protein [Elusimicrobiota bacterium]